MAPSSQPSSVPTGQPSHSAGCLIGRDNHTVFSCQLSAFSVSGRPSCEDTSINCAFFSQEKFAGRRMLPVNGNNAAFQRGFSMLQRFVLTTEQQRLLVGTGVAGETSPMVGAYLFQKGAVGGQGMARISAARPDWNENSTCADPRGTGSNTSLPWLNDLSGTDDLDVVNVDGSLSTLYYEPFVDDACSHADVPAIHRIGWSLFNVTDIVNCQIQRGLASGRWIDSINLLWRQSDGQDEEKGQMWHSCHSVDSSPALVFYVHEIIV